MSSPLRAELAIPNDPAALRLARAYLQQLLALAEIPAERAAALTGAALRACGRIIREAYEPAETGTIRIAGQVARAELVLAISQQGLPFDPSLPGAEGAADSGPSVREVADETSWINHGREGSELRLVCYRPHRDVTEHLPEEQLAPLHEDAPLAPEQEYSVRRFQPEDALGVARCVYRVYGTSYHHEELYYPERLIHQNETGELLSIVALDSAGEVVGHLALERPDLGRVGESGMAVVSPAHRGRHLLERMREAMISEAKAQGLAGIFASAVTAHLFSQRADERFGCRVCGITLGLVPRSIQFKNIRPEPLPQRVSSVLYFQFLEQPAPPVVYAPDHHRPVLEKIYAGLELPADFREGRAPSGPGRVKVSYRRSYGVGWIRVRQAGDDTPAEIRRAREDLTEVAGAEVVYLELPLAQPGTPDLCRAAEEDGFFFSAVGPQFATDGDALRLQFLNVPLDTGLLQIESPFARELLAYIEGERRRLTG